MPGAGKTLAGLNIAIENQKTTGKNYSCFLTGNQPLVLDADYRYENGHFECYKPSGSKWQTINKEDNRRYLKNAYRVLLTRAREGFIIFIPKGDNSDNTRLCKYFHFIPFRIQILLIFHLM